MDPSNMLNIEEITSDDEGDDMDVNGVDTSSFVVGVEKNVTKDAGVKKTLLVEGSGWNTPNVGDEVTVHYVGTLLSDGSEFDSSRGRDSPFKFTLGQGQVIRGWDEGVATMRLGERSKFVLSSEYAYGARGHPPTIPADASLVFDVELLSWKSINDLCGDGGVVKTVISKGEGYEKPGLEDEVLARYVVVSADDETKEIVRSSDEGEYFTLKDGILCPAVKIAIQTMKRGEEVQLEVQPSYAFGDDGFRDGSDTLVLKGNTPVTIKLSLLGWRKVERLEADGSIVKKTLKEGEGYERPNEGAEVTVRFTARLEDGTVFDKSESQTGSIDGGEKEGLTFIQDEEAVVECMDIAVLKMKKGEIAEVKSAPQWAFGAEGKVFEAATVPPNANVVYEIELVSFVKAKEVWDLSKAEKVKEADKKREDGNKLFKEQKYVRAVKRYHNSLKFIEYIDDFPDEEKAAAKKIKLSCYLNTSACNLKLKEYKSCQESCKKALEINGSSVKALFRRAQAYSGTNDHDLALNDLKKALEFEPSNKEIRAEYKKVRSLMAEQDRKEMKMYGSMFKKMAQLAEKEDSEPAPADDATAAEKGDADKCENGEPEGCACCG